MDHLSSSQINVYLLCGLKYRFQYIDKLPRPFKSSALAFGSAFHSTLSWIHDKKIGGQNISIETMYHIFDSDWYVQNLETEIKYKDNEQELSLQLLGKEMLTMYLKQPLKELKGSEVHFLVPLVNPSTKEELEIHLEGYFDLIEADDTVVEFKTTATSMNQEDTDSHIQLSAYGYAFRFLFQKPARVLRIVNFVKKKKPAIITLETQRNEKHYEAFFYLAKEVYKGIRSEIFIPHTGYWCKDCEYANLCPLMKHKIEQAEEIAYAETH
jgi:putative RecB family exonuclease